MRTGIQALTEREKDTLRLLLNGHDAKSIARGLGLSVHTVNERLREARRKLGVSSSREAARLLAEAEEGGPNPLADKQFGVARDASDVRDGEQTVRRPSAGYRLTWLSGGMLIMSLIIAVAVLSTTFHGSDATDEQGLRSAASTSTTFNAPDPASMDSAREWVALLDGQRWEESWREAATLFKSQLSAPQWAASIQSVRRPIGAVSSRKV